VAGIDRVAQQYKSIGVQIMNNFAKRAGIIGATGVAASALFIGGFVAPANASEVPNSGHSTPQSNSVSSDQSKTSTSVDLLRELSTSVPVLLQPRDNSLISGGLVNTGDVASGTQVGDVASGNPIASGNSTANGNETANGNDVPVASGNEVPVASGNETSAGNGNSTPVASGDSATAPIGSGNDTSTDLSNIGASVTDSVNSTVDGALQGVTGGLGLGGVLGR